jgi:flagellar biosynthetic protein FlhB
MPAQERTEQATEKHLKSVRSKGQLQKSRDLPAWIAIAAVVLLIPMTIDSANASAAAQIFGFRDVIGHPSASGALAALSAGLGSVASTVWPLFAVVAVTIVAATAAQGGIHRKKLTPRFDQFDLLKGVRHMFGARNAWELVKTFAKATIVGLGLYVVVQAAIPLVMQTGAMTLPALLAAAEASMGSLLQLSIAGGLLFAVIDVVVVMRRNRTQSRMTKREVTDEHKSTEGDPLVRAHRRSRQLAMSRNRMIAAVSEASVVLVNPTHVAVALKYEPGESAPRVMAKGADLIATRIREEAAAKGVPMVMDVPLARSLHAACDIGQEIPLEFFTPVAHVLAFVMALKRRGGSPGDIHTLPSARQQGSPVRRRPVHA